MLQEQRSVITEDLPRSVRAFLTNGKFEYSFVAEADQGLHVEGYAVVPSSHKRVKQPMVDTIPDENQFYQAFLECLIYDSLTVNQACTREGLDNRLRPYVAAGRAAAYACSWLGPESMDRPESVEAPTELGDEAKNAKLAAHDFIREAAATLSLQVASLLTYMTNINFFNTNHNTGGPVLSSGFLKAI